MLYRLLNRLQAWSQRPSATEGYRCWTYHPDGSVTERVVLPVPRTGQPWPYR